MDGTIPNGPATIMVEVTGPTLDLVAPKDGGAIGLRSLNDRGFLDVTLLVPSGRTVDVESVIDQGDEGDEFTLNVPAGSSVTLDRNQAPVHLGGSTFRYWVNGT